MSTVSEPLDILKKAVSKAHRKGSKEHLHAIEQLSSHLILLVRYSSSQTSYVAYHKS